MVVCNNFMLWEKSFKFHNEKNYIMKNLICSWNDRTQCQHFKNPSEHNIEGCHCDGEMKWNIFSYFLTFVMPTMTSPHTRGTEIERKNSAVVVDDEMYRVA